MDDAPRLLHETTSLCRDCKNAVPARVVAAADGGVWMEKTCASCGPQRVRLSDDATWYEATRATLHSAPRPRGHKRAVHLGCPFDCGPCDAHEVDVRLPVVTITSACNLDCPICYVHNKNEDAFHMPVEEFDRVLQHLMVRQGGELDILNMTGGEPLLHPNIFDLLERARAAGVHRVTVCTNGLRLAKDEAVVQRLAELGARVALSFDSFEEAADVALQGARLLPTKLRCLELLEKHDVDTTLIPVMTAGVNDHEIGDIIALGMRLSNVRHLEIHTMTFTGQGGAHRDRSGRISMNEVLRRIEETTGGLLTRSDFVPSPSAHPLCYQVAYLLLDPAGGDAVSFARVLGREAFYASLSERLYLEPSPGLERAMRDAIDRLWSEDGSEHVLALAPAARKAPDAERTLGILRRLCDAMFPVGRRIDRAEALRVGERSAKAIYVHSHMDEETFDVERVAQCCDSNCYADGSTVPVCAYNVLYRDKEPRFMAHPRAWSERSGGRRPAALRILP